MKKLINYFNLFTEKSFNLDVEKIKNEIANNSNLIQNNEKVYISSTIKKEINCVIDKIVELHLKKGISFTVVNDEREADVLIVDIPYIDKNILSLNKRMIDYNKMIVELHEDMIILTEEIYTNLMIMYNGQDESSQAMACDIISSTNRSDPNTIKYLVSFMENVNASLVSVFTWNRINSTSPYLMELDIFLRRFYPDKFETFEDEEINEEETNKQK